jgi:hypothetical protein
MRLALIVAAVLALPSQPITRAIEIWSADPIAIDIEWLTIDAEGNATVTSRRQTAVGPPAPLEFVHGDDRYVRFSYKGASPRTYSTAELIAAKKLHVPDVLPGGELLLLSPEMMVRPVAFEITGARVQTVPIDRRRHASLSGLPAGDYKVEPLYEGGLKGQPKVITIAAAATTALLVPPEDVGAVRITAVSDVCATATEAGIYALLVPKVATEIKSPPNRARVMSAKPVRCDMTVAGLRPGNYEAFYRRESAGAGTSNFSVAVQRIARAEIAGPPVRVEGRVTFNGKSVPNAIVEFMPFPSATVLTPVRSEATTDVGGYYATALDAPGRYRVALGRSRYLGLSEKQVEFREGANHHDILMSGGTIRVKVIGWDDRSLVNITVHGSTGPVSMRSFSSLSGGEAVLEGFRFGEYKVSVIMGGSPAPRETPDAKTAVLSAATPEVTLTFDVRKK